MNRNSGQWIVDGGFPEPAASTDPGIIAMTQKLN
jgi:hypothetical protein